VTDQSGTTMSGGGDTGTGITAVVDPNIVNVVTAATPSYYTTPDSVLSLPTGSLAATAQTTGTYFTNEGQFTSYMTNYLSTHGNQMPGGVILYLDFNITNGELLDYNSATMNSTPAIFVNHYA